VGLESDITPKKAEETIGQPIYWQIPNEERVVNESRKNGVPLLQHAPRSKVQQAIAGLAKALTGREPPAATRPKSGLWAGLFS